METVLLTALGVGGSTVVGALLGFIFKKIPHKWNDAILSFAAGVMFAAATVGLILPAVDQTGIRGIWQVVLGILVGAVFLNLMDLLVPHLHKLSAFRRKNTATIKTSTTCFCLCWQLPFIICRKAWRRAFLSAAKIPVTRFRSLSALCCKMFRRAWC